jgi:RNA polymerase sigma-70 factor (ECF subfamily)
MRNIFINNYRKKVKQNTVIDTTPNEFLLNQYGAVVDNGAEARLTMKEINASLYSLPEIFRNPFILYFEGYKYHEIAELLSEPLGTIKSRIHFARKLLKEQLSRF